jgi:hypothetical protein
MFPSFRVESPAGMVRGMVTSGSARRRPAARRLASATACAALVLPALTGGRPAEGAVLGRHGDRAAHGTPAPTEETAFREFFPALDPAWSPAPSDWIRLDQGSRLGFGYGCTLNRVDGFGLLLSQTLDSRSWGPALRAYQGYGFTSEEWSGAIEVAFGNPVVEVGARWADETTAWPLPRQAITADENLLAAFLSRVDFNDYLRRRGRAAFFRLRSEDSGLALSYLDDEHRSRRRRIAQFGIFGGDRTFDPNPPVDEGQWRLIQLRGYWSQGEEESIWGPDLDRALLVDAQWSGGELGGEERWFTRLWAEHRGWVEISPAQSVGYRVLGGATPQGWTATDGSRLPEQWQFQLGGVGSLRGHEFQEFRGDRVLLGTLEYGLDLETNVRPVLFVDGGMAWNESDQRSGGIAGSGPLAVDGGAGLLFGSDGLRIDAARDLRAERAPVRVTMRLSQSF